MADLYTLANQFRRELDQRRAAANGRLLAAYGTAWKRVSAELTTLQQKMESAIDAGEVITLSWFYQEERLNALLDQLAREINQVAAFAAADTRREQSTIVSLAQKRAVGLASAATDGTVQLDSLPREALQEFVGLMSDGSPLTESFERLAKDIAVQVEGDIREKITEGLALGFSPERIFREIRNAIEAKGGNAARDPAIARRLRLAAQSSILTAYRESTKRIYEENSDLIKGYRWLASKSTNTCPTCWALDGKFFELQEPRRPHPSCRCTITPVFYEEDETPLVSGEVRFSRMDEDMQRRVLGPAKFEAYKSGDLTFLSDLVTTRDSGRWGQQYATDSLKNVLGDDLARLYFNGRSRPVKGPLGYEDLYTAEIQLLKRRVEGVVGFSPSGDRITFRKPGDADDVRILPGERANLRNGIVTHNHPFDGITQDGGTFSEEDLYFAAQTGVKELRIITSDAQGNPVLYQLSADTWPKADRFTAHFRAHLVQLLARAGLEKDIEELTTAEKRYYFPLAFAKLLRPYGGPPYNLKYQRVTP